MLLMARIWLRAALTLALLIGCSSIAPAMAASDAVPGLHVASCHGHNKNGVVTVNLCSAACMALPAQAAAFDPPRQLRCAYQEAVLAALEGRVMGPGAPPPRSA